ncbi:HIT-like domain-containing protein [Linnemannia elongata]|nr:HIT-like domain-containing protein [Linnemannia elongata]
MSNKDTKFIDSEEVIRTQDGKIDLFQTILARKDPTAQIPVFASHSQPAAMSGGVTNLDATKSKALSSSSSSSPSWRSARVAPGKTSASASAPITSSPYATNAPADATTTISTAGRAVTSVKPAVKKMLWSAVFVEYCKNPLTIPEDIRYWHDDDHIIIKDAYAKAKVHMLVLPRKPVDKVTDLVGEAGVRTVEELERVATTLLRTLKAENAYLDFKMGFHVIPSMSQLHLHVISQDFCSPRLKNAAHWNSFNTGFFIPPEEVIKTIREKGSFEKTTEELKKYARMKKVPMVCNQCSQVMKSVPMLNHHLGEHFTRKVKALKGM